MTPDEFTTIERQCGAAHHYMIARGHYQRGWYDVAVHCQRAGAWWSSLARGEMDAWIVANHPEWCNTP